MPHILDSYEHFQNQWNWVEIALSLYIIYT